MPDLIRAFVAVRIPLLPQLQTVLKPLVAMRWPVAAVAPENLHVTLKFLGDIPTDQIAAIQQQLLSVVRGQPPFVLAVEQLGAFPSVERPSVVWVGLVDAEPLVALVNEIESRLEPLGFARESRAFHPHLTVARIKGRPPRELFDIIRRNSDTHFGTAEVRSIDLIRSELCRDGARYSLISSHELVVAD